MRVDAVYFLFILLNSHASMHIKWSDYVGGFCIFSFLTDYTTYFLEKFGKS